MAWKKILLTGDAAELADEVPLDIQDQAAAQGTAVQASRQDHLHDVLFGSVAPVVGAQAAGIGTAVTLPRADHVHGAYGSFAPSAHDLNAHGTATAVLYVGKQQLHEAVLHRGTAPPASPGTGQIYYNSSPGTLAPYMYDPAG